MNQQTLIDELKFTLANRLEFFAEKNDYDTMRSIYSEFVVNQIEPKDGEYIWLFVS
jgi:hypothetical protein